jgi:hypothetical protein
MHQATLRSMEAANLLCPLNTVSDSLFRLPCELVWPLFFTLHYIWHFCHQGLGNWAKPFGQNWPLFPRVFLSAWLDAQLGTSGWFWQLQGKVLGPAVGWWWMHCKSPVCQKHEYEGCTNSKARTLERRSQVNRTGSTVAKTHLSWPCHPHLRLGFQSWMTVSLESSLVFVVLWSGKENKCRARVELLHALARQTLIAWWHPQFPDSSMLSAPSPSRKVRKEPLSCPRATDGKVPRSKQAVRHNTLLCHKLVTRL